MIQETRTGPPVTTTPTGTSSDGSVDGSRRSRLRRPSAHPILNLLAQRVGFGLLTIWAVSVLVFVATTVLPGNAAYAVLGHAASAERIREVESQLHLNGNIVVRYWHWLSGLLSGHVGDSLASHQSVLSMVGPELANTAILMLLAGIVSTVLGLGLGALAALRRDRLFDHVSSVVALAVTALPEFVVAIGLVILFSTLVLHWFPAVSVLAPGESALSHPLVMVLPVATLVIVVIPYLFRMTRGVMIEALDSEYAQMATLKGATQRRIVVKHALPNSIPALIQVTGLNFLYLAGGVVIVEYVFNYNGIGFGLVNAVNTRDVPVIQFIVLVLAAFYIVVNIVTDVVALITTPRLRLAR